MTLRSVLFALVVTGCGGNVTPDAGADAGSLTDGLLRVEASQTQPGLATCCTCTGSDGGTFRESTWQFDVATSRLTWRVCDATSTPAPGLEGNRVLDAAEVSAWQTAMKGMTPSVSPACISDATSLVLDLTTSTATTRYWGNEPGLTGICFPTADQKVLDHMKPVFDVFHQAATR